MNNLSLDLGNGKILNVKRHIWKDIIVDRKSKYTCVGVHVRSRKEVQDAMKELLKDKYFAKATHNTYAFRIKLENGSILEQRNDDGETGAGNCILRELQRENMINTLIVVTRYFGGIQLHSDRFKNVIDATKMFLGKYSKEKNPKLLKDRKNPQTPLSGGLPL